MKDVQIVKEKNEMVFIQWWHDFYIGNPRVYKATELVSDFIKVSGYKVSVRKSIVFPHTTRNEEVEIRKKINVNYNSIKNMKCWGIHLTQCVQELHAKN